MNEEYSRKVREREARQRQEQSVANTAEQAAPGMQERMAAAGGAQMTQAAGQGSAMGTAGGAMMMSGNPYLMGAGLGMQVLAAGEQNRRAQEEAQRQAYNDRIRQRQMAMSQIASMGIQ